MNILAIDPGLNCGYAINTTPITSGVLDLKGNRFEGAGMRYIRLRKFLNETRGAGKIDLLVYEEVRRHLGTAAAHTYGAIVGHIQSWCEENKIPYSGVPVGTIKKAATGKGNANKAEMIRSARNAFAVGIIDDNQADALWLLEYARENYGD